MARSNSNHCIVGPVAQRPGNYGHVETVLLNGFRIVRRIDCFVCCNMLLNGVINCRAFYGVVFDIDLGLRNGVVLRKYFVLIFCQYVVTINLVSTCTTLINVKVVAHVNSHKYLS